MRKDERAGPGTFLEALCLFRNLVYVVFVISVVMFVLSLISLTVVEPGSGTHVIVVANLVGLGAFILTSGAVLYRCRNVV